MTGFTSPDSLPYPDDYNDPADVPAAIQSLADAVQAALDAKSLVSHTHPYSPNTHNHDGTYAAASHSHNYAAASHTHNYAAASHTHAYAPSAHGHGTISVQSVNLGTINAGSEVTSGSLAKGADQTTISAIVVAPSSTYLLPVLLLDSNTSYRVKVRNTTSSTTHTNVTVYITLARQG